MRGALPCATAAWSIAHLLASEYPMNMGVENYERPLMADSGRCTRTHLCFRNSQGGTAS